MPNCGKYLPAQMRSRLALQAESQVSDGQGGQSSTWNTVATVWAKVEPVKSWERMQAMQLQAPVTHKITIRHRPDVTHASRFLLGGRIMEVVSVLNPDERNQFLEIKAIERA